MRRYHRLCPSLAAASPARLGPHPFGAAFVLLSLACVLAAVAPPPLIAQETESQPEVSVAVPPDAEQIAAAVLAAPEDRRAEATVIGWRADGSNVTLREGSNDIVCLADDPRDAALNIACYHRDLEPYMARGRQLSFEGVQGKERSDRRFAEIEAGELPMPAGPRALYVTTGRRYDPEKGEIEGAHTRWVLYVPGATAEELGLPAGPTGGVAPWLMGEGTPGAHIMITPPRDGSP